MEPVSLKIFVDDIRSAPEGWVRAKTITEAVRMLHEFNVSEISLDHDIAYLDEGGRFVGKCHDENFTAVARFIALLPEAERPGRVFIHTSNPAGAFALEGILKGHVKELVRDTTFAHQWGEDPLLRKGLHEPG